MEVLVRHLLKTLLFSEFTLPIRFVGSFCAGISCQIKLASVLAYAQRLLKDLLVPWLEEV